MPTWTGYLNSSGTPIVKVNIGGVFANIRQEFEAVIDTGYTGFLSMPLIQAFPLGLLLFGTTGIILADGSTAFRLTFWGHVTVGEEDKTGIIVLEPNATEVLIGTTLLKTFHKRLVVSHESNLVLLEDEAPRPETAPLPVLEPMVPPS